MGLRRLQLLLGMILVVRSKGWGHLKRPKNLSNLLPHGIFLDYPEI